ncbi:superoxide dismutase family protein [Pseudoxanthomonas mexicana]|uniref:superoxide dismutase family protein n=1 Tax=Pseudoxanthomonas mexicana TaxID=128785 RepID=UPI00398A828B
MRRSALIALAASLSVAACSSAPERTVPAAPATDPAPSVGTAQQAVANLASASGSLVSGKVTLTPMGNGVHITGEVGGLPPNSQHGFHVHEKGDCSAADASSAGAHFNPFNTAHGKAASGPHHAGDMDNIVSDAQGVAKINAHAVGVTLGGGAANDIAGRGLIVHAAPDDYRTQPTGNAGARLACGVITVTR